MNFLEFTGALFWLAVAIGFALWLNGKCSFDFNFELWGDEE